MVLMTTKEIPYRLNPIGMVSSFADVYKRQLCFFLFVCLLSECIPSNFIRSHHSKNLLLTLTNKLFAAHKENTNYYLLKLYCL